MPNKEETARLKVAKIKALIAEVDDPSRRAELDTHVVIGKRGLTKVVIMRKIRERQAGGVADPVG